MKIETKKVVLLIVEGPTDENTLSPVLKPFFHSSRLLFHVIHGDITTQVGVNPSKAVSAISQEISAFLRRSHLQRRDILRIIHVVDTDGAFIPDEAVLLNEASPKIAYQIDTIETGNPAQIIGRNHQKSEIIDRLTQVNSIQRTPYQLYYFSRNMEHALHGEVAHCSNREKIDMADDFADAYDENPEAFRAFLSAPELAAPGYYRESWDFIFEGTRSLHRHSNLHLALPALE